jgi:hypothetical protein
VTSGSLVAGPLRSGSGETHHRKRRRRVIALGTLAEPVELVHLHHQREHLADRRQTCHVVDVNVAVAARRVLGRPHHLDDRIGCVLGEASVELLYGRLAGLHPIIAGHQMQGSGPLVMQLGDAVVTQPAAVNHLGLDLDAPGVRLRVLRWLRHQPSPVVRQGPRVLKHQVPRLVALSHD